MNFDNLKDINELPLTLNVAHIAKVLGLSKNRAYDLCHSTGFPCKQVGKRLIIPRPAFEKWMEDPFYFERID